MHMCRLRHTNDSVLSSLKMEGTGLFFFSHVMQESGLIFLGYSVEQIFRRPTYAALTTSHYAPVVDIRHVIAVQEFHPLTKLLCTYQQRNIRKGPVLSLYHQSL
jgi:hypothetical protein